MVDNISYVQGPTQALAVIHCPHIFSCLSEPGVGGLEGCIGLPVLQLAPCLSGSCLGREGHGCLVYKYTCSIGNCATW